ncbi:HAD family hydrolase [Micromonospora sp. M12]
MLTQTARVHNAAWTQTFDEFLRQHATASGEPFQPFDPGPDYNRYVDGRPARTASGRSSPPAASCCPRAVRTTPDADTVNGVGNRKNVLLLQRLRTSGVEVYPGSVRYLQAASTAGLRRAVVTASANGREWSPPPGWSRCWRPASTAWSPARRVARQAAPRPFLAGAQLLGVDPTNAAVFEDALSGSPPARRRLRLRGWRRPGRAGRGAAGARRRHRRDGSRRPARRP